MNKPRLLDLFCGAGGAAMGYHRAGFDVYGVDNKPQPHYPFLMMEYDALDAMDALLRGQYLLFKKDGYMALLGIEDFAAFHASPPCQSYCALKTMPNRRQHLELIEPTRKRLKDTGKPFVIENVVGAPLINAFTLCGTSFGLSTTDGHYLQRHRRFETNIEIWLIPPCQHGAKTIGVYGDKARDIAAEKRHYALPKETRGKPEGIKILLAEAKKAMGIDWMNAKELSQAIPPAYTEYIGKFLFQAIKDLEEVE